MSLVSKWNLLKAEANLRVLLLVSDKSQNERNNSLSTTGGDGLIILEDIRDASVRLNGNSLFFYRPASSFSNSTTTSSSSAGFLPQTVSESSDIVRILSLTGDAVLHQFLFSWSLDEKTIKLLSECRVIGKNKSNDKVPSEKQLQNLIVSYLLTLCDGDSSGGFSTLKKYPQEFLFISGDGAISISVSSTSIPAEILQQNPGVLLWFEHKDSYSFLSSELPFFKGTSLFSEWWRILQRSLLLPCAEVAVDHLLLCQQQTLEDKSDKNIPDYCLYAVKNENGIWNFSWKRDILPSFPLSLRTTAVEGMLLSQVMGSPIRPYDKSRDSVWPPPPLFPVESEFFSFSQEHQRLTELRSSEGIMDLLSEELHSDVSNNHRKTDKIELTRELQWEAIQECEAHFVLSVHVDTDATSGNNVTSLSSSSSSSSTEKMVQSVWYLQLVMQYTEMNELINCALGGVPHLRLTPCAYAASHFVLINSDSDNIIKNDDTTANISIGKKLYSVEYPSVFMDCIASSKTEWTFFISSHLETGPTPFVRISSNVLDDNENVNTNRNEVFPPDTTDKSFSNVVKETHVKFLLNNASQEYQKQEQQTHPIHKERQEEETFYRIRVIPPESEKDSEWHLFINLNSHTLIAVPSSTECSAILRPVYASLTPLWRTRLAAECKRYPYRRKQKREYNYYYLHKGLLHSPTSQMSNVDVVGNSLVGSPFSPLSDIGVFLPLGSIRRGDMNKEEEVEVEVEEEIREDVVFTREWKLSSKCYQLFSSASKSLRQSPLQIVFVGGTAVGKTTIVRWFWAKSRSKYINRSNNNNSNEKKNDYAEILRELDNWFRRHSSNSDITNTEETNDEDIVHTVFQSPLDSYSSGGGTTTTRVNAYLQPSVELKINGQTHIFNGEDAKFLLQSSTGVNDVILYMEDYGLPVNVRIVDIPGCSSRELLRTHCMEADIVICAFDVRDHFSLLWLEERLDVILAGSLREKTTRSSSRRGISDHTETFDNSYLKSQQEFILLRVNDGSSQQVVYSREIQEFLKKTNTILGSINVNWFLWSVPGVERIESLSSCNSLYTSFLDLLQKLYASRLISTVMGWDKNIILRLEKFEKTVEKERKERKESSTSETILVNALKSEFPILPLLLCELIVKEFQEYITGNVLGFILPIWWQLLRWMMVALCISDPLAHCFWMVLQISVENKDTESKDQLSHTINNNNLSKPHTSSDVILSEKQEELIQSLRSLPNLLKFTSGITITDTNTIDNVHDNISQSKTHERHRFTEKIPIERLIRSLRTSWPEEDVDYSLDWRSMWSAEDEAQFIRSVQRTITRYEDEERRLRQQLYGVDALQRFAPPTCMYTVTQLSYSEVDASLEEVYKDVEEDMEPL